MQPASIRSRNSGAVGVAVFCAVAVFGMSSLTAVVVALGGGLNGPMGFVTVLAAMGLPSLARVIATRTVDREFQTPLPLRTAGPPRLRVFLVPLAIVVSIYGAAYGLSSLVGIPRAQPTWMGATQVAVNLVVNGVLASVPGLAGALGEEWGWRGYLQPRLDQLGIPGSPWVLALIASAFHAPFIIGLRYVDAGSMFVSLALFTGLELGLAPTWTWVTYRLGSIWAAVWLHTLHNTISQLLFPKTFGEASGRWLGESGALPCFGYLVAALVCVFLARRSSGSFNAYLRERAGSAASHFGSESTQ